MPVSVVRALLLAFGLITAAIGCAAPVLPLPPPVAVVEAPDADGNVRVTGEARAGAFVACLNENTEYGVLVRSNITNGAFEAVLPAEVGHEIRVWQFEGGDDGSQPVFRVVPEP